MQRNSPNKYVKNYDFDYPQLNSQFTVTSVIGHLLEQDFDANYGWQACDPFALFDAPIITKVKKDNEGIARNLKTEARRAQTLMIWTDCDREGENIGAEIMGVCREVKRDINVRRARFSAIIAQYVYMRLCLRAGTNDDCIDRYTAPRNIRYSWTWRRLVLLKHVCCWICESVLRSHVCRRSRCSNGSSS